MSHQAAQHTPASTIATIPPPANHTYHASAKQQGKETHQQHHQLSTQHQKPQAMDNDWVTHHKDMGNSAKNPKTIGSGTAVEETSQPQTSISNSSLRTPTKPTHHTAGKNDSSPITTPSYISPINSPPPEQYDIDIDCLSEHNTDQYSAASINRPLGHRPQIRSLRRTSDFPSHPEAEPDFREVLAQTLPLTRIRRKLSKTLTEADKNSASKATKQDITSPLYQLYTKCLRKSYAWLEIDDQPPTQAQQHPITIITKRGQQLAHLYDQNVTQREARIYQLESQLELKSAKNTKYQNIIARRQIELNTFSQRLSDQRHQTSLVLAHTAHQQKIIDQTKQGLLDCLDKTPSTAVTSRLTKILENISAQLQLWIQQSEERKQSEALWLQDYHQKQKRSRSGDIDLTPNQEKRGRPENEDIADSHTVSPDNIQFDDPDMTLSFAESEEEHTSHTCPHILDQRIHTEKAPADTPAEQRIHTEKAPADTSAEQRMHTDKESMEDTAENITQLTSSNIQSQATNSAQKIHATSATANTAKIILPQPDHQTQQLHQQINQLCLEQNAALQKMYREEAGKWQNIRSSHQQGSLQARHQAHNRMQKETPDHSRQSAIAVQHNTPSYIQPAQPQLQHQVPPIPQYSQPLVTTSGLVLPTMQPLQTTAQLHPMQSLQTITHPYPMQIDMQSTDQPMQQPKPVHIHPQPHLSIVTPTYNIPAPEQNQNKTNHPITTTQMHPIHMVQQATDQFKQKPTPIPIHPMHMGIQATDQPMQQPKPTHLPLQTHSATITPTYNKLSVSQSTQAKANHPITPMGLTSNIQHQYESIKNPDILLMGQQQRGRATNRYSQNKPTRMTSAPITPPVSAQLNQQQSRGGINTYSRSKTQPPVTNQPHKDISRLVMGTAASIHTNWRTSPLQISSNQDRYIIKLSKI